eukprot:6197274-Pleurochrysis_carterae.AAC.3
MVIGERKASAHDRTERREPSATHACTDRHSCAPLALQALRGFRARGAESCSPAIAQPILPQPTTETVRGTCSCTLAMAVLLFPARPTA